MNIRWKQLIINQTITSQLNMFLQFSQRESVLVGFSLLALINEIVWSEVGFVLEMIKS